MKKYIILSLFPTLIPTISYSQDLAAGVTVHNTRDINDLPNFTARTLRVDFKRRSTIGVPGSGEYSGNITLAPWYDATGNLNHQLNFNDGGIYYRTGDANNSIWNAWQKVITTDVVVTGVPIYDTRDINDLPNFAIRTLRADFKRRSTIGVPGNGEYSSNITLAPWYDATGNLNHQLNFNDGGIYYRTGDANNSIWNAWQKVITTDADSNLRIGYIGDPGSLNVPFGNITKQYNIDFCGYRDIAPDQIGARIAAIRYNKWLPDYAYVQNTALAFYTNALGSKSGTTDLLERMRISPEGNIGIGTINPDQKLTVKGKIHAEEVIIDLNVPLADYVFKPEYKLLPLDELEQFVKMNNHLPEIPSASDVEQDGLSLGEMQNKLLQKIEELTLYVIQQEKKNQELEQKVENLTIALGASQK